MNEEKIDPNLPKEISWHAPEFPEYRKHPLWFVFFGILVAMLVLYGIYTKSWTTAIVFGLMGVLGLIYGSQKPRVVEIKLNGIGINVNSLTYSFKVIKKFWIIYEPSQIKVLYFETNAYLDRIVKIELEDQDPRIIKSFLKQYIEEDLDGTESTVDLIARKLKF